MYSWSSHRSARLLCLRMTRSPAREICLHRGRGQRMDRLGAGPLDPRATGGTMGRPRSTTGHAADPGHHPPHHPAQSETHFAMGEGAPESWPMDSDDRAQDLRRHQPALTHRAAGRPSHRAALGFDVNSRCVGMWEGRPAARSVRPNRVSHAPRSPQSRFRHAA